MTCRTSVPASSAGVLRTMAAPRRGVIAPTTTAGRSGVSRDGRRTISLRGSRRRHSACGCGGSGTRRWRRCIEPSSKRAPSWDCRQIDDLESLDGMPARVRGTVEQPPRRAMERGLRLSGPGPWASGHSDRRRCPVHRIVFERQPRRRRTWPCGLPGGAAEAWADLIVVTGGTYGSPELLLRSGVGPAQELWDLGVPIVADVAGVGRNLHDHPSFELSFEPTDELVSRTQAFAATGMPVPDEQGFAKAATTGACRRRSVRSARVPRDGYGWADRHLRRLPHAALARCAHPASPDVDDPPRIDHAYLSDEGGHDLAALTEGVELARGFASSPAMRPLVGREIEPGPSVGSRDLAHEVRHGRDPLLAPGRHVRDGLGR